MQQILDIVFIFHMQSIPMAVSRSQLPGNEVKSGAQALKQQHLAYVFV
jgi:hypothetical protein